MHLSDTRIRERIISPTESMLSAFKQMDRIYQKLLNILEESCFVGLISAGDIQPAIIKKALQFVFEPHILKEIPEKKYFNMTSLIETIEKRNGKIGVFPISERSLKDLGNWDEYMKSLL